VDELSAAEIHRMQTPLWEQAKIALGRGKPDEAAALIDRAVTQWRSLQDYSINWVTSLLSFIADELGEEAVERALRRNGEDFIHARRMEGDGEWDALPAAVRAKVIARAMVANFGAVEVDEDDEKIVLSFRCGTGGRMIDEGRYDDDGGPYRTLREPAPRTFNRDSLPVYCAHCSVNNEIQRVEWGVAPTSIEFPPEHPGEPCVHHVYKDVGAIPAEAYRRIGKEPPD
jgi:hypothetical protein